MARAFDGTDDYLRSTAPAVTTYPLTYSFWVNLPSTASNAFLMMLVTSSVGEFGNFAVRYHSSSNRIIFRVDSTAEGGSFDATAPTAISANTWYHVFARAFSNTDRRIRINNGTDGTNSTLCNPALIDWLIMGAHSEEGGVSPFSAIRMAEVGIYNVALSDEDGAALSKGLSPQLVRPESLVHYYPMIGRASPESDLFGAAGLTVTGATAYDHPRVIYPSSRRLVAVPSLGSYSLTAAQGSFALTGQAVGLRASRTMAAAQASFTLTGQAASLEHDRRLTAAQATFALNGQAATLTRGRIITAGQGSFSLTGVSATLKAARRLAAAQGSFTLTGIAADLPYGAILAPPLSGTTVAAGSLSGTGITAPPLSGRVVSA